MNFELGDMVRPTREAIISYAENDNFSSLEYLDGFQILKIEGDAIFYGHDKGDFYHKKDLEFIPEKSEFKYGEIIEVSNDKSHRCRIMFIAKTNRGEYVGTYCFDESRLTKGISYSTAVFLYARKHNPQLTRGEIAEKLGISENFTLID